MSVSLGTCSRSCRGDAVSHIAHFFSSDRVLQSARTHGMQFNAWPCRLLSADPLLYDSPLCNASWLLCSHCHVRARRCRRRLIGSANRDDTDQAWFSARVCAPKENLANCRTLHPPTSPFYKHFQQFYIDDVIVVACVD